MEVSQWNAGVRIRHVCKRCIPGSERGERWLSREARQTRRPDVLSIRHLFPRNVDGVITKPWEGHNCSVWT